MIGKTRHEGEPVSSTTVNEGVGPARGILRRHPVAGAFWHSRTAPAQFQRGLVEHFWRVRWDLSGVPDHEQETLPHPSVHIVIDDAGGAQLSGPHSARFVRRLCGRGGVFGIKFKPGGFYPFLRAPVAGLVDQTLPLSAVFGASADDLERAVRSCDTDAAMIEVASAFLQRHWPAAEDPTVAHVSGMVASIVADRSITTVDQLVARSGMGKRALQRLFERYVGVSPKWVISRYRLHEAVEQLALAIPADWAAFALSLGYFDQAHFIRDFKSLVGRTPLEFAEAECRR